VGSATAGKSSVHPLLSPTGKTDQSKLRGRFRIARDAEEATDSREDEIRKLFTLGYLQGYHKAPAVQGVTVYDANLAYDGLNLYNSGHAAEASIMDMEGKVLHMWRYDIGKIWRINPLNEATSHWRRVHLYENGDILAIYDGLGMIRLDKDSNLVWHFKERKAHHHMQVAEDGKIYVLTERWGRLPELSRDRMYLADFITILGRGGKIMKEYSLLESFANSPYSYILSKLRPRSGELFHTNTVQLLDGSVAHISPLFKKGNVLVCVLFLNTIAIVDLEKNAVVWALEGGEDGLWNGMHEPVLLENGNILIFDNDSFGTSEKSKVVEFNPFTQEVVWRYEGDEEHPFYSFSCGTNQRLANGNTLITESDNGRAFEVTREGQIVWEYVSPHRAGEDNALIATLLHVERIDYDFVEWLALEEQ
jgi:outer membrane protein assembly factor BamB